MKLYVSALELEAPRPDSLALQLSQVDERYRPLVAAVGLELSQKLASCRLFMVPLFGLAYLALRIVRIGGN